MKIFRVFALLFLALLCGGKSSFAQFGENNLEPATPEVTNGIISWAQTSPGNWSAIASTGKYTVSNRYTFSNNSYLSVINGFFNYRGGSVLSKPDPDKCETWFYEASFTQTILSPRFIGGSLTVDSLYGTHDYTACPTVQPTATPTPIPTATPTPPPKPPNVESQTTALVAGGVRAGRFYSSVAGNPHQVEISAKLEPKDGVAAGQDVKFEITSSHEGQNIRPGFAERDEDALLSDTTVKTDAEGVARVVLTSGSDVGSVAVDVTANGQTSSRSFAVEKAESDWDATAVEEDAKGDPILRLKLSYAGLPVNGHPISWRITKVKTLSGRLVDAPQWNDYARLTGVSDAGETISTTGASVTPGEAAAYVSLGWAMETLNYSADDQSIYLPGSDGLLSQAPQALQMGPSPMALAAVLPYQKHQEEAKVTIEASPAVLQKSSSKPVSGTTPIDLRKVRESTSPQGDVIKETGNLANAQVPVMFKTWMKFSFDPTVVFEERLNTTTGKKEWVMKELDEDDFKALVRDVDWSSSSGASSSNTPQAITSKEFGSSLTYFFKFMGPELIKEFAKDQLNPLARGKRVAVTVYGLGTGFVDAATGTFQMVADPTQTWSDIKVLVGTAANENQRQLMTAALQAKLAEHYDIIYRDAVMADGYQASLTFGKVGGYFQFNAVLNAGVVRSTKMLKGVPLIRRGRALVRMTTRVSIKSMGRMIKPAQAMTQFGLKSMAARGLRVVGKWTAKTKPATFAVAALKKTSSRILRYNPATQEFVVSTINRSKVPLGIRNGVRCYYARITFVVNKATKQLRITGVELMEHLPKCFVAGTPILMADGTHHPIEQIKAGDLVMSRDEATGATKAQKVVQTFENQVQATLVLRFKNGETIETTKTHPFYVESQGFTPAGEMGIGTSIVTRAGPVATLAASQVRHQSATVYNFEVENTHTYFVGHSDLWVHNACSLTKFRDRTLLALRPSLGGSGPNRWQRLVRIPENAIRRTLTPVAGGAQEGFEYTFQQGGKTWKVRLHSADLGAPAGSNASKGWIARIKVGTQWMDGEGVLHPNGIHNPASPFYDEALIDATHIPFQPPAVWP